MKNWLKGILWFFVFLGFIFGISYCDTLVPRYEYKLEVFYTDNRASEIVYISNIKASSWTRSSDFINNEGSVHNYMGDRHYYNVFKVRVINKRKYYSKMF